MRRIAYLVFLGYVAALVLIGASGTLIAEWELRTIFAVPLETMGEQTRSTLLNQYRFLKAMELAFGLFCLWYRHDIQRPGRARNLFLAGALLGVAARSASVAIDGMPHPVYLGFAAYELLAAVLVWAVSRPSQAQTSRIETGADRR
jgi:peptidoglycan/LPS O-acetylase OafA/YrhL